MYLMCHVLVTVKKTSPTKDSLFQLGSGPTAHHRRPRHVSLSQAPRTEAPPAHLSRQSRPGIVSLRRSLASSHLSPPDQRPRSSHSAYQPRLTAPAHGPPESSYSRPLASLPRHPGHRSSKTSLGFISTPLIWQGRKRPTGGRRPASTRAPPRPTWVHITKPAVPPSELQSTSRPSYTRQPSGFGYTPGYTQAPGLNVTTDRLHASTQPTSQAKITISNQESPTAASEVSISSQGFFTHQHRDEALDTKESMPGVGASHLLLSSSSSSSLLSPSSALSYRKNKPVAPQWSLLSVMGGENQTVKGNWTDPLELSYEDPSGSESFVYDLTEFAEEGGSFSLYELDAAYSLDKPANISPAFISPDANNQQSDSHGTSPFTRPLGASKGRSEHLLMEANFHSDSESLLSRLIAGNKLSLTYSQDGLNPGAVTVDKVSHVSYSVTVSQTLTGAQTHHTVSNSTSSSGQKLEENPSSQAATQLLQTLTFQPTPSLIIPPLLVIHPTPSLPMIRLSSSAFYAEESLPKQIFSSLVPQKEDIIQISESSLSLLPLDSMHEVDIAGSDVESAVAQRSFFNNLYSTDLHSSVHFTLLRSPLSSNPSVFPSSTFISSLNIPHHSTSTALPLTSPSSSLAASTPFTSSQSSINLSTSLFVSPSTVILQIPTPLSLYTSYTLPPLPVSPPVCSTTIPLPPSAPQHPSPFLSSYSQQSNQRLSQADGVVESGHVPESDGVSVNFQPSLLSLLSLSSNLQRDFVVTRAEKASLLSLPLFSKAPSETQMPVVEGAVLPEYPVLSTETPTNNISGPFRSQLPYPVNNQFLDAQSDILTEPAEVVLDSFDQINATPSELSVENLAFSSVIFTPDLLSHMQPSLSQLELLVPDLDLSLVLQPSSNAASLSVSQFLTHPDQRYLSNIHSLPHVSHPMSQSDIGFTSLPAAGIWAFERTPALLWVNIDRSQDLRSASLSATSSSSDPFLSTRSPLSHHIDSASLTVSSETLPADMMMQVADVTKLTVGDKTAVSSMSLSHDAVNEKSLLLPETFSSGSQDRLTFNRVPWRLQHTTSHLHTDNQVNLVTGTVSYSRGSQALHGYDDAFNHPTSSLLNPSVMVPTQTLALHSSPSAQLGTTTPQPASGLDYTHHSGLTQTNTEQPRHTHSSTQTQMFSQSAFRAYMREFLDASEELEMNEIPGHGTQYAEACVDAGGLQKQPSHLTSSALTPLLFSSSTVFSVSLAASPTPPLFSLQLSSISPTIHPSRSISPLPLSSFVTPPLSSVLPSWLALQPAAAASVAKAEIGSLFPTPPTAGFGKSTTTQPAMDNYLQPLQRFTTHPISQSIQSIQQLSSDSQSFPLHQASSLPDDKLKSNHSQPLDSDEVYDKDELLPQLANNSETVDDSRFVIGPRLSTEISNNLTAAGKVSHPSALFDPADVVPKIQIANEHDSDAGQAYSVVNTKDNGTLDVMLDDLTGLQPDENLNPKATLNTLLSFPAEMKTVSPLPLTAVSTQPTGALVISTPLHTSGLNIPSSTPASRSSTGSSINALNHGIVSGLAELSPPGTDNHTTNTAGLKYISKSNTTTVTTLKDSPSAPAEMTDTAKAKNATTLIEHGSMEASQGNVTGNKPTADLSISKTGLNSGVLSHSWSQSAGVNGAMNPDYNNVKVVHLSTTQPVVVDAHLFITTKHSSPTSPFKAVSASAISGGSGGLKNATVRTTPGSPSVDLTSRPALPCQCKQRFNFTCLCGLSTGNSM